MPKISVHAVWLAQDDPKKNTAVLASKRGNLRLHKRLNTLPKRGIILEPLCGKVFGPEDHQLLLKGGSLVGLDCSWAHIEESVREVMQKTRLKPRMLPLLLAANPVNWGKPGRLTTAEALATVLYLIGERAQAREVLGAFRWGERFFELNKEPLDAYAEAKSSSELVDLQFEFFDIERPEDSEETSS
jgi:pre-rRNA-processing protein TSR3|tara:strand:+ start:308 stop:868 length:561 start_codon:yes stop_codon:yes gene_type:complete